MTALTPARRAWLEKLRDEGPQSPYGNDWEVADHCLKLGWTRYFDGSLIFEEITPAGRRALEEDEG